MSRFTNKTGKNAELYPSSLDAQSFSPEVIPIDSIELSDPRLSSQTWGLKAGWTFKVDTLEMQNPVVMRTPVVPETLVLTAYGSIGGHEIALKWTYPTNVVDLNYYELQVSSDQTNWYALKDDGTGWQGAASPAVTVVWTNFRIHSSIPFTGTGASPTGLTLYYRVRAVTRAPRTGQWSTASSGTISPVPSEMIEADAIVTAKLADLAVELGKIANGAVNADKLAANSVVAGKVAADAIVANNIVAGSIRSRELVFGNAGGTAAFEGWDPAPDGSELFDLRQPDCKSSEMREPTSKEIVFLPGILKDELGTEYANQWSKFSKLGTIGVFKAATNIVGSPEDLTDTTRWNIQSATPTLSSLYFGGRRFTKYTGDNTATYSRSYQTITTTNAIHAVRALFRRGATTIALGSTGFQIIVWDSTAGNVCIVDIPWDKSGATASSGGTLISEKWYGDVCEILAITATCNAKTDNRLYIVPILHSAGNTLTGDYGYATAVMCEASVYPTPYTPTSRAAGLLNYTIVLPTEGAIEVWAYGWAGADSTDDMIFSCRDASGNHGVQLYRAASNKFTAQGFGTTENNFFIQTAAKTNAQVRTWNHFKLVWSKSANNVDLYLNKVIVSDTKTKNGTGISAMAPAGQTFWVGNHYDGNPAYVGNLQITDLLIWPTADVSTTHYDLGKPYYDPSEVANWVQGVRISAKGVRMHNAGLTITDDYNRLIDISNRTGLLARDAAGTVIHDIPTASILGNAVPMGHYYPFRYNNAAYTLVNTETPTLGEWVTGNQALMAGNSIIHGIKLKINLWGQGAARDNPVFSFMLRPTGSAWGAGDDDMTPMDYIFYNFSSAVVTATRRQCVLDVWVGNTAQYDYFVNVQPYLTSRHLCIQQLGVWI